MDKKHYDILISNLGKERRLYNNDVIVQLIGKNFPEHIKLTKLNDIFQTFLSHNTIDLFADPRNDMKLGAKLHFPVFFEYEQLTWRATIVQHKWLDNYDKQEWYTLSIKLPNDGYIYSSAYEFRRKDSDNPNREWQFLDRKYYNNLKGLVDFSLKLFGQEDVSLRVFYSFIHGRMNFKVRCVKLRMWLQITFEYSHPKEKVDRWYNRNDLLAILNEEETDITKQSTSE